MIRVVIDTNIIVAAMLSRSGPAARLLDVALEGRLVEAHYDRRLLAEYEAVLLRPKFGFEPEDIRVTVRLIGSCFVRADVTPTPDANYIDPTDAPIIETAIAIDAEYVVTRNHKHIAPHLLGTRVGCVPPGKLHVWSETRHIGEVIVPRKPRR